MMKIVLVVLAVIAVVVIALVAFVAMQPSSFRIARSTTIAAPPAVVFGHVNDLKKMEVWSPWAKIDPAMKTTYTGAESGVGQHYEWVGNAEVGEGSMTIKESVPNERIGIELSFKKPYVATNDVQFTFVPEGEGTTVTWAMSGTKNFMFKAVHLVMNMEKMVGGPFEQGLAELKRIAEAESGQ